MSIDQTLPRSRVGNRLQRPLERLLILTYSIAFGGVLQALPVMQFKDRDNYLAYAQNSVELLILYIGRGPVSFFTNEPLWLIVNAGLGVLMSPEAVMRCIIFTGATVFAYVFISADRKNALWLALFLLTPQLLKNYLTHLRQGLALAIFFAGYFAHARSVRFGLMLAAPFVHASFFIVLPLVIAPNLLRRLRLAIDIRLLTIAAYALFVALSLGALAALLGARQSTNYDFVAADVSGFGLVFWVFVVALFVLQGRRFLETHQVAMAVLLFYVITYYFIEVTARIFESGLPLVLLAGLALTGLRRLVFIGSYLSYAMIQLLLRLQTGQAF